MAENLFETTIGAFEERMALRRKMLSLTGVQFPKRRIPKDVEDQIRDSIINCYECESGETCALWQLSAADGTAPPDFCPNHDTILRLKSMGCSMEAGS